MAVNGALVHDELAVDVFAVDHVAVSVKLIGVTLRAEGDEHGQRTEVVDVVVDVMQADGGIVGDVHAGMEGQLIQQCAGA